MKIQYKLFWISFAVVFGLLVLGTEYVRTYVHPFMLAEAKMAHPILSVENLVLDIPVIVSWQLSKRGIRWPVSHGCIVGWGIQVMEFFVFDWSRAHVDFLKIKFSLLTAYGKRWINWGRQFLKHPSRASLLALAKSIYYIKWKLGKNPSPRWDSNPRPCVPVKCSNHWATGDSMASNGEMWVFD